MLCQDRNLSPQWPGISTGTLPPDPSLSGDKLPTELFMPDGEFCPLTRTAMGVIYTP